MTFSIETRLVKSDEFYEISLMIGELLNEIMQRTDSRVFNFDQKETELRVSELVTQQKYWIIVATGKETGSLVGLVSLCESYALYAEGAYATMPELYVKKKWRSRLVGQKLIKKAAEFALQKGWRRIEVTTPPLPQFENTLSFYQSNGFEVTGGRKLKIDIVPHA